MIVTLAELLAALGNVGLALRRAEGDAIEVVGDASALTADIKAALGEHKPGLLELLPEPRQRPAWWSPSLTDAENEAVDEFMGYGPEGEETAPADADPCDDCGSLHTWRDSWGTQYCRTCTPPTKSVQTAEKAERLRKEAAERLADDSIPMFSRHRSYRGAKARRKYMQQRKVTNA